MAEIGMVFGFGYVVLDGVLEIVNVDELNVELVVVMFYFLQKIMVGFAGRCCIQFIAQMDDVVFCLTKMVAPLVAFGQQRLVFGYSNHNIVFIK